MIKSMTGYGKTSVTADFKTIVVEIRTLNSKQFDFNSRIAAVFRDKETAVRALVGQHLERGKIDVTIAIESNAAPEISIDKNLAKAYYDALVDLSQYLDNQKDSDIFAQVIRIPDVIAPAKENYSDAFYSALFSAVEAACAQVNDFREQEGAALAHDFEKRIALIDAMIDEIEPYEAERVPKQKQKFLQTIADLKLTDVDANRLEQELVYFVEKLDITEEKVRLRKHCAYFLETLREPISNGKKLGFIVQECGREVNTIGSKCNDFHIQQIVVRMKDEVEKLKEQLANIL